MMWLSYLCMALLLIVGMLLIFIILLQRGRGGGLAGALGGMGGQSAFGTKAGDFFTRVTVVLAVIWIVLGAGQIPLLRAVGSGRFKGGSGAPELLVAPPAKDEAKAKAGLPEEPLGDEHPGLPKMKTAPENKKLKIDVKPGDGEQTEPKSDDKGANTDESKPDAEKSSTEEKKPESTPEKPKEESKSESKSDSDK